MKASRLISYLAFLLAAFLFFMAALIWWEESKVTNTDFIPIYENDGELYALVEKGRTSALSHEESRRLDWLIADKKKKSEAQLREFLEEQKN